MVQAYEGDGICAYFGVPAAHEDDPERGARAACASSRSSPSTRATSRRLGELTVFAVRVAINTGQAAVGLVGAAEPEPSRSEMRPTSLHVSRPSPSRARSSSGRRPPVASRSLRLRAARRGSR